MMEIRNTIVKSTCNFGEMQVRTSTMGTTYGNIAIRPSASYLCLAT